MIRTPRILLPAAASLGLLLIAPLLMGLRPPLLWLCAASVTGLALLLLAGGGTGRAPRRAVLWIAAFAGAPALFALLQAMVPAPLDRLMGSADPQASLLGAVRLFSYVALLLVGHELARAAPGMGPTVLLMLLLGVAAQSAAWLLSGGLAPDPLVGQAGLGVILALSLLISTRGSVQVVAALLLPLAAVAVFRLATPGGLIATLAAGAALWLARRGRTDLPAFAAGFLALTAGVYWSSGVGLLARAQTALAALERWIGKQQDLLDRIAERPFAGVGLDSQWLSDPALTPLIFLVEMGLILGLMPALGLLLAGIVLLRQRPAALMLAGLGALLYAAGAAFSGAMANPANLYLLAFLTGLALGAGETEEVGDV